MHIILSILLTVGAFIFFVCGLASVLEDLLERSPYAAPLSQEEQRALRDNETATPAPSTELLANAQAFAASAVCPGKQESCRI